MSKQVKYIVESKVTKIRFMNFFKWNFPEISYFLFLFSRNTAIEKEPPVLMLRKGNYICAEETYTKTTEMEQMNGVNTTLLLYSLYSIKKL